MKNFLKLTFLFEVLIGIALIIVPKLVISLLFEVSLEGSGGIIIAMIAGGAILSLSLMCWLMKNVQANQLVKSLLFYNVSVVAIVVYGLLNLGIKGPGVWLVVIYHSLFALWSASLLRKNDSN